MRRRKTGRIWDKLCVLPFLLVCVLFVWFGMTELLPGTFGMVWTALASGITLYAWIALLMKPSLAWKPSALLMEGTEAAADTDGEADGGADVPPAAVEDPLMAEVDRILGPGGVLEAALESDTEQRERLEELKALYELHSVSEEEYERKFREIWENRGRKRHRQEKK